MNPIRRLVIVQGAALLWLLVMVTALIAREPARATLRGAVIARQTGQPIPNALVEARGAEMGWWRMARTDARGEFVMRGLPVGQAMLQASSKVHRMPKEEEIVLREGTENRITLVASPVEPFLELEMPQRVYTPDEEPRVTCTGYTRAESLKVTIRRVSWHALRSAREAPATPYDQGLRVPSEVGELVSDEKVAAAPKDVEGALRCKIAIPPLSPGIYSLWVRGEKETNATVFSVSRIGLITKTTKRDLLACVVDLTTGAPVPEATVTLFRGPNVAETGRTDADGLFRTTPPAGPGAVSVIAEAGGSTAFTRAEAYFYDPERPFRVYLYTDRPIYRPGQTVYYKGIVRERDGGGYRVPVGEPVRVQVRAPTGALLARMTATTNDYGSFHGDFRLAPGAAIGQYAIETAIGGGVTPDTMGTLAAQRAGEAARSGPVSEESFSFNVAEYRKPEYLVEVQTALAGQPVRDNERPVTEEERPARTRSRNWGRGGEDRVPFPHQYVRGDRIAVTVTASYVWGAPVKDADVTYRVTRQPYWSGPEDEEFAGYYAFEGDDGDAGEPVLTGQARTDAAGRLSFTFDTALSADLKAPSTAAPVFDNQDYLYLIEAEVTDAGRMPVTGTGRAIVSRASFRLQIEPGRFIAAPGESFPLRVRTLEFDGTPRPETSVLLVVGRQQVRVTTDADGVATHSVPATRPGAVPVTAAAVDERGNRTEERVWLWVAAPGEGFSDPSFDYADLELVADKKLYQPGETATVMLQTSRPGDYALVTLEGRELYNARVVHLATRSTPITVPLTRVHQPNVYLTVTTVRGKTYRTRDLRLNVSPQEHALTVQVTADRERYGPREEAVYRIRTLDARGRPVAAEASLGLVDESIYAIMPDAPLTGLQAFYGRQENRVSTAFSFPEIYLAADKESGPQEVRRDFPDTASWLPVLRTGPDGRATVRLRLPDTLTTWRATVRAHTLATQVGSGISKIVSTKPLLVRLETPRFFVQNDEAVVSGVVHNDTDRPQRVTVTLLAPALTLRDAPSATLDVPGRGFARRDWRVALSTGRQATLRVSARADRGPSDAVELKRPILPHGTQERHGASGEVSGDRATVRLHLPAGAVLDATECQVTLNGSPVGVMLQALDYLNARDYATSENVVGWFLPAMTVAMALRDLGLLPSPAPLARAERDVRGAPLRQAAVHTLYGRPSPHGGRRTPHTAPSLLHRAQRAELDRLKGGGATGSEATDPFARLAAELPQRVQENVARLYRMQSYDGGWGWGEGAESDAFWTAYVLYGLDQARRAGYLIDADVIERGAEALRQRWPKVPDESNRALCLYVLQRVQQPPTPETRRALRAMATRAPKLQNYARALVALALADLGETDLARRVVRTLHNGAREKGDETWWPEIFPWGFYSCNDNETTGYAMMALIRLDPTNPRIDRAARWLMRRREGDGWASTEDTASVIYALAAYMRHIAHTQAPDCTVTVRVNDRAVGRRRLDRATMFRPLLIEIAPKLLVAGENEIVLEKSGRGAPLYSAFLRTYVGRESITPASSGLVVKRVYLRRLRARDIHGRWRERDVPVGTTVRSGEEVVVRLTVHAPRACREVILRDPLPAGCEGLDPLNVYEGGMGYYGETRREVRDRDVTFYAGFLRPGVNTFEYRFRAQIPGDYHVMPAQAFAAYIPEIWGRSGEGRIRVRE